MMKKELCPCLTTSAKECVDSNAGLPDVNHNDHVGVLMRIHVGQRQVTDDNEMRNAYIRANELENQTIDLIEHLRTRVKELEAECRRLERTSYD